MASSKLLHPDRYAAAVENIPIGALQAAGIKALLIDMDNTLFSRANEAITLAATAWLEEARATGLAICLLSNNFHSVVLGRAATLGLPIVHKALKPLPFGYLRALALLGRPRTRAARATTAVIGDQLFTDVLGAHLLGMRCVLVRPLSTTDLWYTRLFRRAEARILRRARPQRP
jgi:HAD superfamily phosphatase (TIGR01668 family)